LELLLFRGSWVWLLLVGGVRSDLCADLWRWSDLV